MTTPSIEFNDGSAVTMSLVVPRLGNWTPENMNVGPSDIALGTGLTYRWTFRTDYCAAFEVPNLQSGDLGNALRLKDHLEEGNTITVRTADVSGSVYSCTMWPGRPPEISFADRQNLEYSMTLFVKNVSSTSMVVYY